MYFSNGIRRGTSICSIFKYYWVLKWQSETGSNRERVWNVTLHILFTSSNKALIIPNNSLSRSSTLLSVPTFLITSWPILLQFELLFLMWARATIYFTDNHRKRQLVYQQLLEPNNIIEPLPKWTTEFSTMRFTYISLRMQLPHQNGSA